VPIGLVSKNSDFKAPKGRHRTAGPPNNCAARRSIISRSSDWELSPTRCAARHLRN
jgi:hypothetical protein